MRLDDCLVVEPARSGELSCRDVLGAMGDHQATAGCSGGPMLLVMQRGRLLARQDGGSTRQLLEALDRATPAAPPANAVVSLPRREAAELSRR